MNYCCEVGRPSQSVSVLKEHFVEREATTLEVVKNPASYIPSKFSLQKLELEDLISYADDAGDFRFDIKWKALNESGKEVSIFVDTKNYSQASNMFKDLRQFKAYLGSIDNFDQMYYIQQGGRGVTQQQIINRLQSAIKPEMDDVFEIIWKNDKLRESVFGDLNKSNLKLQAKSLFTNEINSKSSKIFNSILMTK